MGEGAEYRSATFMGSNYEVEVLVRGNGKKYRWRAITITRLVAESNFYEGYIVTDWTYGDERPDI